jgi:hypothetical protein
MGGRFKKIRMGGRFKKIRESRGGERTVREEGEEGESFRFSRLHISRSGILAELRYGNVLMILFGSLSRTR